MNSDASVRANLEAIVGAGHVLVGDDIAERYRMDISRKFSSRPAFAVRPASTGEVAKIVALAGVQRLPVTVIGGQTSTVGAAVPAEGGLALSLERMNRIVEIDAGALTMTVEAGCIVQIVQEAAEAQGMLLPLDLGARGSATVGGVIGTNAGGNRVLRWGMVRDMVIGLEVVLADGTVVSSLTKMLKDNAGYNWKHLLIGSEGTLGIVTRAVLRLRPLPSSRQTALLALGSFEQAAQVLRRLEMVFSGRLSSFELMWEDFYQRMTEAQLAQRPRPIPLGHALYALVEAMGSDEAGDAAQFERALGAVMEEGIVQDAVLAQSERERLALWAVREDMQPGIAPMRPFISYDVSMRLADMPGFVKAAQANLTAAYPNAQTIFYGHAGDGNLHAIVSVGAMNPAIAQTLDSCVFSAVRDVGGSISAEHGIGVSRRAFLSWTRSPAELQLMRALKQTLDPNNILNPGKVFGQ